MAQTIAVLSQKGGTGKTTTVRTLADVLRRVQVKTLAVDLDPQGNLSDYFDVPPDSEPTIADVLGGAAKAGEAIHGDVIPASLNLAETELMLGGKIGREMTLRRALANVQKDYEVVLVDCPPSLGLLTVNALVAADYALVTAEAQYFALQGVEQAMEVIEVARDSLNDELELLGVLLNLADMRTVHSREAKASLQERFGEKVFETAIRSSIAYAESAERARSILDHRPDLGADYIALGGEVLDRLPGMGDARRRLASRAERREPSSSQLRRGLTPFDPPALGSRHHLELGDTGTALACSRQQRPRQARAGHHRRAGDLLGAAVAEAVELAHARRQRAEHHQVVYALGGLAAGRHRDFKGRGKTHVTGLLGQVQILAGQLGLIPGTKLRMRRRRHRARHLEQLAEIQVVLPQRFALLIAQRAHQALVEPFGGIRDHRDRPQHQLGIERRVGGAGRVARAGVLDQLAHDSLVHHIDGRQDAVGAHLRAEEDRLEHAAGVGYAPKGRALVARVLAGTNVVEGLHSADAQCALAVHQAHRLLFVHHPQNGRAAREITVVLQRFAHSENLQLLHVGASTSDDARISLAMQLQGGAADQGLTSS